MKKPIVLAAVLLLAGAQAPASDHAGRQLNYSFQIASSDDPAGGTGTIHVTLLGRAKNGGIILRSQDDWLTPLAQKTINHPSVDCEVYDTGSVVCMKFPMENSEVALLPFLAIGLPRAINAGTGTYTVEEQPGREWDFSEQLDGQPTQTGDQIQMTIKGTESDAANRKDRVAATVTLDATTGIPTDISFVVRQFPYDAGASYSTVKVHLQADPPATP